MTKTASYRAFTLIELLVVISIIALLIAILLPALGSARASARNTECLSRMKSLAVAIGAYEADNNGFLPPGFNGNGGFPLEGGGTGDGKYWSTFLDDYLDTPDEQTTDFYLCPDSTLEPGDNARRLSYSANDKVMVNRLLRTPVRSEQFRRASDLVTFGDAAQNAGNGDSTPTYNGDWISAMGFPPDPMNRDRPILYDKALDNDDEDNPQVVIRFRHNANTTANHGFLDGHAESNKAGVLLEKNFASNY